MWVSSKKTILSIFIISIIYSLEHSSCSHVEESYSVKVATPTNTFNVLKYGAKGDGKTDDAKAFQSAWSGACKLAGSTLLVPRGYKFLVSLVTLVGPCKQNIVFQLDGTIIAPPSSSGAWGSGGTLQWMQIKNVNELKVQGTGIIEGSGSGWWNYSPMDSLVADQKIPSTKPTALRFYGCTGVTVTGITIQNSPKAHLKFDNCNGVQVYNIKVTSPESSPNTDGIHLQNTKDVTIHNTNIACGDDCISIQTGCSGVNIYSVTCGPGHGISIGGLGKDNTKACVSNITVTDSTMKNTLTGVRIKTWQGGSGIVSGVKFSNIQCQQVKTPIMIDQFYCDNGSGKCANKTTAVEVTDVSYQGITGTYISKPVDFACSDSLPCTNIALGTIDLKPAGTKVSSPFCSETYGQVTATTTPQINCLRTGKQAQKNANSC